MMTRAQRRFHKKLSAQTEAERLGAPIPGEIAQHMTKPKVAEILYQVFVDVKGENGSRPVSPKFAGASGEEACYQILEAINGQICLGKFKGWGNARIEPIVPVSLN